MSGSHGTESGVSGLTDNSTINIDEAYWFYHQDCELLGIKPGPYKRRLPLTNWDGIPDIKKPAEKNERFDHNTLLQNMDIRIANICYYFDQQEKLILDIQEVNSYFY